MGYENLTCFIEKDNSSNIYYLVGYIFFCLFPNRREPLRDCLRGSSDNQFFPFAPVRSDQHGSFVLLSELQMIPLRPC